MMSERVAAPRFHDLFHMAYVNQPNFKEENEIWDRSTTISRKLSKEINHGSINNFVASIEIPLNNSPYFLAAVIAVSRVGQGICLFPVLDKPEKFETRNEDIRKVATVRITEEWLKNNKLNRNGDQSEDGKYLNTEEKDRMMRILSNKNLGDVLPDSPQPFFLLHTSGSTGKPKCVIVTHEMIAHEFFTYQNILEEISDIGPGIALRNNINSPSTIPIHTSIAWPASTFGQISLAMALKARMEFRLSEQSEDFWEKVLNSMAVGDINVLGIAPAKLEELIREAENPSKNSGWYNKRKLIFTWGSRLDSALADKAKKVLGEDVTSIIELFISTEMWCSLYRNPFDIANFPKNCYRVAKGIQVSESSSQYHKTSSVIKVVQDEFADSNGVKTNQFQEGVLECFGAFVSPGYVELGSCSNAVTVWEEVKRHGWSRQRGLDRFRVVPGDSRRSGNLLEFKGRNNFVVKKDDGTFIDYGEIGQKIQELGIPTELVWNRCHSVCHLFANTTSNYTRSPELFHKLYRFMPRNSISSASSRYPLRLQLENRPPQLKDPETNPKPDLRQMALEADNGDYVVDQESVRRLARRENYQCNVDFWWFLIFGILLRVLAVSAIINWNYKCVTVDAFTLLTSSYSLFSYKCFFTITFEWFLWILTAPKLFMAYGLPQKICFFSLKFLGQLEIVMLVQGLVSLTVKSLFLYSHFIGISLAVSISLVFLLRNLSICESFRRNFSHDALVLEWQRFWIFYRVIGIWVGADSYYCTQNGRRDYLFSRRSVATGLAQFGEFTVSHLNRMIEVVSFHELSNTKTCVTSSAATVEKLMEDKQCHTDNEGKERIQTARIVLNLSSVNGAINNSDSPFNNPTPVLNSVGDSSSSVCSMNESNPVKRKILDAIRSVVYQGLDYDYRHEFIFDMCTVVDDVILESLEVQRLIGRIKNIGGVTGVDMKTILKLLKSDSGFTAGEVVNACQINESVTIGDSDSADIRFSNKASVKSDSNTTNCKFNCDRSFKLCFSSKQHVPMTWSYLSDIDFTKDSVSSILNKNINELLNNNPILRLELGINIMDEKISDSEQSHFLAYLQFLQETFPKSRAFLHLVPEKVSDSSKRAIHEHNKRVWNIWPSVRVKPIEAVAVSRAALFEVHTLESGSLEELNRCVEKCNELRKGSVFQQSLFVDVFHIPVKLSQVIVDSCWHFSLQPSVAPEEDTTLNSTVVNNHLTLSFVENNKRNLCAVESESEKPTDQVKAIGRVFIRNEKGYSKPPQVGTESLVIPVCMIQFSETRVAWLQIDTVNSIRLVEQNQDKVKIWKGKKIASTVNIDSEVSHSAAISTANRDACPKYDFSLSLFHVSILHSVADLYSKEPLLESLLKGLLYAESDGTSGVVASGVKVLEVLEKRFEKALFSENIQSLRSESYFTNFFSPVNSLSSNGNYINNNNYKSNYSVNFVITITSDDLKHLCYLSSPKQFGISKEQLIFAILVATEARIFGRDIVETTFFHNGRSNFDSLDGTENVMNMIGLFAGKRFMRVPTQRHRSLTIGSFVRNFRSCLDVHSEICPPVVEEEIKMHWGIYWSKDALRIGKMEFNWNQTGDSFGNEKFREVYPRNWWWNLKQNETNNGNSSTTNSSYNNSYGRRSCNNFTTYVKIEDNASSDGKKKTDIKITGSSGRFTDDFQNRFKWAFRNTLSLLKENPFADLHSSVPRFDEKPYKTSPNQRPRVSSRNSLPPSVANPIQLYRNQSHGSTATTVSTTFPATVSRTSSRLSTSESNELPDVTGSSSTTTVTTDAVLVPFNSENSIGITTVMQQPMGLEHQHVNEGAIVDNVTLDNTQQLDLLQNPSNYSSSQQNLQCHNYSSSADQILPELRYPNQKKKSPEDSRIAIFKGPFNEIWYKCKHARCGEFKRQIAQHELYHCPKKGCEEIDFELVNARIAHGLIPPRSSVNHNDGNVLQQQLLHNSLTGQVPSADNSGFGAEGSISVGRNSDSEMNSNTSSSILPEDFGSQQCYSNYPIQRDSQFIHSFYKNLSINEKEKTAISKRLRYAEPGAIQLVATAFFGKSNFDDAPITVKPTSIHFSPSGASKSAPQMFGDDRFLWVEYNKKSAWRRAERVKLTLPGPENSTAVSTRIYRMLHQPDFDIHKGKRSLDGGTPGSSSKETFMIIYLLETGSSDGITYTDILDIIIPKEEQEKLIRKRKFNRRLKLGFSDTQPWEKPIPRECVFEVPDIISGEDVICNDGNGWMSYELAECYRGPGGIPSHEQDRWDMRVKSNFHVLAPQKKLYDIPCFRQSHHCHGLTENQVQSKFGNITMFLCLPASTVKFPRPVHTKYQNSTLFHKCDPFLRTLRVCKSDSISTERPTTCRRMSLSDHLVAPEAIFTIYSLVEKLNNPERSAQFRRLCSDVWGESGKKAWIQKFLETPDQYFVGYSETLASVVEERNERLGKLKQDLQLDSDPNSSPDYGEMREPLKRCVESYEKILLGDKYNSSADPSGSTTTNSAEQELKNLELIMRVLILNREYVMTMKNSLGDQLRKTMKLKFEETYYPKGVADLDEILPWGQAIYAPNHIFITGWHLVLRYPCKRAMSVQLVYFLSENEVRRLWNEQGKTWPSYLSPVTNNVKSNQIGRPNNTLNKIIFSAKSSNGMAFPELFGGGDEDGDNFLVITDKRLSNIFLKDANDAGTEYRLDVFEQQNSPIVEKLREEQKRLETAAENINNASTGGTTSNLIQEITSNLENSRKLGGIDNKWTVLVDCFGVGHPLTQCYGYLHELIVDQKLPDGLEEIVKGWVRSPEKISGVLTAGIVKKMKEGAENPIVKSALQLNDPKGQFKMPSWYKVYKGEFSKKENYVSNSGVFGKIAAGIEEELAEKKSPRFPALQSEVVEHILDDLLKIGNNCGSESEVNKPSFVDLLRPIFLRFVDSEIKIKNENGAWVSKGNYNPDEEQRIYLEKLEQLCGENHSRCAVLKAHRQLVVEEARKALEINQKRGKSMTISVLSTLARRLSLFFEH